MVEMMNKQHPLYQEDLNYILGIKGIGCIQNKKFLITGATGLIGVCLVDALMHYNLKGANIKVYAVGRNKEKSAQRLGEYYSNENFCFIEQDVREPLPQDIQVDFIIPLASNTHPLAYSQYPIETIEINVKGVEHALQKASSCGALVLYPSTVEVYGNSIGNNVFTEDYTGQLNLSTSRSCYTESKRVSEALCQSYISEKNVRVKIVRLCRVFGPTMLINDTKASSQFIIKALKGENILLKSSGEQYFSYAYVSDVVAAMLYVLVHGKNGVAYNIANDKSNVHLKDFAKACASIVGTKVEFELPTEVERNGYSVATQAILNSDRIKSLGFSPKYTFDDAIRRTISIINDPIYIL